LIKKLLRRVYEYLHLNIKGWVTDEDGTNWVKCEIHGLTKATPKIGYREYIYCQSCLAEREQLDKIEEPEDFCGKKPGLTL